MSKIMVRMDNLSDYIILDQIEKYDVTKLNIWPFKHIGDIIDGVTLDIGNMTSRYSFEVNGVKWRSSEELYLAGEFSYDTATHRLIQEELRAAKSPYAAKRFVKRKYHRLVRADFSGDEVFNDKT